MFSVASLEGYFALTFDGQVYSATEKHWLPIAATGVLHADGAGNVRLRRIVHAALDNVNPPFTLEQEGTGRYALDSTGIGKVTLGIKAVGSMDPPAGETFRFVINEKLNEVQFITAEFDGKIHGLPTFSPSPLRVIARGSGEKTPMPSLIVV